MKIMTTGTTIFSVSAITAVIAVFSSTPALAQGPGGIPVTIMTSPKPKIAVLALEVKGKVDADVVAMAKRLTEALRERASQPDTPYEMSPRGNQDLLQLKMLAGCTDTTRSCMKKIGKRVAVEVMLYGSVERTRAGYAATLVLFNARRGESMNSRVQVGFTEMTNLERFAALQYNLLLGIETYGRIMVRANTQVGTVLIDGRERATLEAGYAEVPELTAGRYTLSVQAPGYEPYTRTVSVGAGKTRSLRITLVMKDDEASRGRPGGAYRKLFWGAAVTAGVSAGLATAFGLQVRGSLLDDKEAALRELRDVHNIGFTEDEDACQEAAAIAGGNAEAQAVVDACDKGDSRARLANIMIGTSIGTAVLAGVFFWKGYLSSSSKRREDSAGLHLLTPVVTPTSVSAGVSYRF